MVNSEVLENIKNKILIKFNLSYNNVRITDRLKDNNATVC